jgi:hypothetical protein
MVDKPEVKPKKRKLSTVLMERNGVKANVNSKEVENFKKGNWVEVK